MSPANQVPQEVSASTFAALVGLSDRRVRQLIDMGIVARSGRGKVYLAESVRALLAEAKKDRDTSPLAAARARAADARARATELRAAREAGELIPLEDALEVVERVGGMFLAGLSGLPARATRDLKVRGEIDRHCDALRNEIVAEIEKIRAESRAARPAT